MTYAYLTDGLDPERRDEFDRLLEKGHDEKKQAKREKDALTAALRFAG